MAQWRPDPTFYPSAKHAMEAPQGGACLRRPRRSDRTPGRMRSAWSTLNPKSPAYGTAGRRSPTCRTPATSCITSAGTPAARCSAPTRRTPTWSGAIWSCPASARSRIHIIDTKPDPTPAADRQDDRAGGGLPAGPATPPHTRPLRTRRDLRERARRAGRRRTGRHLHARPRDLRRPRPLGAASADPSISPTTSGGTSATTP